MTGQQLKQFVLDTLVVPRDLAQEIDVFNAIIDFCNQSDTGGIPIWTNALTFNSDATGDGAFCTHPSTAGILRFFISKTMANINNEPPTSPSIDENTYWKEVSPSPGSGVKEWAPGVFGDGLVIVYYDLSGSGLDPALYLLSEAIRPFSSTDLATELAANQWRKIVTNPNSGNAAKTKYYTKALAEHTAATAGASTIINAPELADGESVTIDIQYTFKDDGSNTGGAGRSISNWTKAGGVLVKSWEDDTLHGNNTGSTYTCVTSDSSGSIRATLTRVSGGNISWSWTATIVHRKP